MSKDRNVPESENHVLVVFNYLQQYCIQKYLNVDGQFNDNK